MTKSGTEKQSLISIIIPVYNEAQNITHIYERLVLVLDQISDRYQYEIIFTDNCSLDNTFNEIQKIATIDPRVRLYKFTRNFGFQRSILTGYRLARGDAAVQIDCDLQDPPELILDFIKLWEAGYKIVYGVRQSRPEALMLRTSRRLFYRMIAWLSNDELPVDAGDFRLVDRCVLDQLHHYNDENPYLRGYISSLGYQQVGVGYDRARRERGKSGFSFRNLVSLATDGIISHSILPLRLASMVGFALSLIAVLMMAVYLGIWMFSDSKWPAGFATISLLILFSMAINSVFLGIMGEYVARIYSQVKPQPLTIVEKYVDSHARTDESGERRATQQVSGIVMPVRDEAENAVVKAQNNAV